MTDPREHAEGVRSSVGGRPVHEIAGVAHWRIRLTTSHIAIDLANLSWAPPELDRLSLGLNPRRRLV